MGYGTSPYGFSPYGGVFSLSTINVVSAWAISTHSVRVTLSAEPMHLDQFSIGDATNPATWTVVDFTDGRTLTVVAATMHDTTSVDVVTLEPLGDHLNGHTVTAVGLISSDGLSVTNPTSADFLGVVQTVDPVDAQRADFRDRDLANPPFQGGRSEGFAGTLVIGSDGDFETEAGIPLIKKLVLRRLNTPRGSFRHLPTYGVAVLEKEPITGGGLVALLRDIEDQAKQEPDVLSVRARGSIDRSGVLTIQLSVSAAGGATIDMRMGSRSGRLLEF
jgi:hypothetical protein